MPVSWELDKQNRLLGIMLRDEICVMEQIVALKCKAFVYLIALDCQSGESCLNLWHWLVQPRSCDLELSVQRVEGEIAECTQWGMLEGVTDTAVGFPDGSLAAKRSGFRSQGACWWTTAGVREPVNRMEDEASAIPKMFFQSCRIINNCFHVLPDDCALESSLFSGKAKWLGNSLS